MATNMSELLQVTILTMISGHMWNHIRKPPYIMPGQNGQINYIANGYGKHR